MTIYDSLDEPIPDWADRVADSAMIQPMQQLITKDASRRGNATILEIRFHIVYHEYQYLVGTDAGNVLVLTRGELLELFEPGPYIHKEVPNPKLHQALRDKR